MKFWIAAAIGLAAAGSGLAGTPGEAAAIIAEYKRATTDWMAGLRDAATREEQRRLIEHRPDAADYGRRMQRCIGGQLDEAWTLAPAAWLLRLSAAMRQAPGGADEWVGIIGAIRGAVERHHLASKDPGLTKMCIALVDVPDPASLAILEKVEAGHPESRVQGVAALAISMVLKNLGDEGDVMARRLRMLRKAIIESADVEIDRGVTVAKVAEDELYVIRYLSKGRKAPDLSGVDVAGRPLKLSDFDGKVVVLLFWGAWNGDAKRLIEMAGDLQKKMVGKPFQLIGVNSDPRERLFEMVKIGEVTWKNFSDPERVLSAEYRITAWPIAFVLDRGRVIRYIGPPGSFVDLTVDAILNEGD